MIATKTTIAVKPLIQRFVVPAIAVWLLYLGVWMIFFAVEQPVMSMLTRTDNWFIEHFSPATGTIEVASWGSRLLVEDAAGGAALILLGLLVGQWAVRRKRKLFHQLG